jgi:hypothetical protein
MLLEFLMYNHCQKKQCYIGQHLQGDQNVSVHQMIRVQEHAQSDCLAADRLDQVDTRLTLTPSVIPNSNYVIMVRD